MESGAALSPLPHGWSCRQEADRWWWSVPERGEHLTHWLCPWAARVDQAVAYPHLALQGFIDGFRTLATIPMTVAGLPAWRVIGTGAQSQRGLAPPARNPIGRMDVTAPNPREPRGFEPVADQVVGAAAFLHRGGGVEVLATRGTRASLPGRVSDLLIATMLF